MNGVKTGFHTEGEVNEFPVLTKSAGGKHYHRDNGSRSGQTAVSNVLPAVCSTTGETGVRKQYLGTDIRHKY